ncbi:MAG: hypothetical protein ACOCZ4_02320 [Bacteroidota bacterium]
MAAAVAVGVAALQQLKLTVAGRYFKGAKRAAGREKKVLASPS